VVDRAGGEAARNELIYVTRLVGVERKRNVMSARQIDLKEVPGIDTVLSRLRAIDSGLAVAAAAYDFDRGAYILLASPTGFEPVLPP
jgi:hypothetical protein